MPSSKVITLDPQLIESLRQIIVEASSPNWLEGFAFIATIVAALAAVATLSYTAYQIKQGRIEARDAARVEEGRFLFSLDQLFESPAFQEVRAEFATKYDELMNRIANNFPHKSQDERIEIVKEEFSKWLYDTRGTDPRAYVRFLTLCGFFESVGVLCYRKHASKDEIFDLYSHSIVMLANATETHILHRIENEPHFAGFMENFLKLAKEAREYDARRAS